MIKKWSIPLGILIVIFLGYRFITDDPYPEVTSTAYQITIDKNYRLVQTSAKVCVFQQADEETGWNFLVEDVEFVNWDEKYIIMQGYDKTFYIFNFETEELLSEDSLSSFLKEKEKLHIDFDLKNKNQFEQTGIK